MIDTVLKLDDICICIVYYYYIFTHTGKRCDLLPEVCFIMLFLWLVSIKNKINSNAGAEPYTRHLWLVENKEYI